MKDKVHGNLKQLFSMHGQVNPEKVVDALFCMSEITDLDIDTINKTSETGALLISSNGKILDTCKESDEIHAKYKIVPTGIKLRYSTYPLFASFIKINNFWEGAFIGTGIQLFEMYKQHYKGTADFCDDYKDIFGGDNRSRDINGFGLIDVINNGISEDTIYNDKDEGSDNSIANSLALAIEKLHKQNENDTKGKKSVHMTKSQRKAARLQAHLDRIKDKERNELKKLEQSVDMDSSAKSDDDNLNWLDIMPLEESTLSFEDEVTVELNKRIHEYINGDSKYDEYDKEEILTEQYDKEENTSEESSIITEEETVIKDMDHDNHNTEYKEKEKYKLQMKLDLISDIYERLLCKEYWMLDANRNRLGFYLKGICLVAWHQQKYSNNDGLRGNGYVFSENKQKCVINTGLFDKYGNYIYLIDHTPLFPDFYDKKVSIMYNKAILLEFGFNIKDIRHLPEPISFVDDKSKLLFNADIDDFDLNDDFHLNHIINERIERFPKKFRQEPEWVLCDKLKVAIKQAINISKVDYRYVIPKYDFYRQDIQFLIPFYLENNADTHPELTIVVGKHKGIWQIFTILYPQDAYDDARLICRPSDSWLNIHK